MTTVALIPSYQPDERLVELVSALRVQGCESVVVDDGSGCAYREIFARAGERAQVIGYEGNRGKGYALKYGLRYIQGHYPQDTVVVTVDADGQHDPADVLRCAAEAREAEASMVLGCRCFDGADVPLRSKLGNIITRGVYRLTSGAFVSDTQTGLRAFTVALVDFLVGIGGDRYEYEMNVLMACPAEGVSIREVPIHTIYEEGNASSHFRPVRDSVRIYGSILGFVASSFASFLVDYALFGILSAALAAWGGPGIVLANVGARLVSATCNFLINRHLVFRSRESLYVTAVRYALVAGLVMVGNTCAMLLLVQGVGTPALLAKLFVETGFFLMSWVLQNRVVFQRRVLANAVE